MSSTDLAASPRERSGLLRPKLKKQLEDLANVNVYLIDVRRHASHHVVRLTR